MFSRGGHIVTIIDITQKHSPQILCLNFAQLSQPPSSRLDRCVHPEAAEGFLPQSGSRAGAGTGAELAGTRAPGQSWRFALHPSTESHSQLLHLGTFPAFPCFSRHRGVSSPPRDIQQLWQWPWFQELFSLVFCSVVRNVRHPRSICDPAFIPKVRIQRENTTRTCFGPSNTLWVAQGTKKSLP